MNLTEIELEEKKLRDELLRLENLKKSIPIELHLISFRKSYKILSGYTNSNDADVGIKFSRVDGDIINVLKSLPSRSYSYDTSVNVLNIKDTITLLNWVKQKENINLIWKIKEEDFRTYLTEKLWKLDIDKEKNIIIGKLAARAQNNWPLSPIPGIKLNTASKLYEIPVTEGWRLFDQLVRVSNLPENEYEISQELLEIIEKQIKEREELDNFSKLEDYDIEIDMNGHTPRNFQKVALGFTIHSLDVLNKKGAIIADQPGLGKTIEFLMYAEYKKFNSVLCIMPALARANWVREIQKFTGEIPFVINSSSPTDSDIVELMFNRKRYTVVNYDLISRATKYDVVDEINGIKRTKEIERFLWIELLNKCNFDLIGIDEGHYIKNVDSARSRAILSLFVG